MTLVFFLVSMSIIIRHWKTSFIGMYISLNFRLHFVFRRQRSSQTYHSQWWPINDTCFDGSNRRWKPSPGFEVENCMQAMILIGTCTFAQMHTLLTYLFSLNIFIISKMLHSIIDKKHTQQNEDWNESTRLLGFSSLHVY